jgi:hypothetical protein
VPVGFVNVAATMSPLRFSYAANVIGVKKLGFKFTLTMASYNLIRLPKLIEAAA